MRNLWQGNDAKEWLQKTFAHPYRGKAAFVRDLSPRISVFQQFNHAQTKPRGCQEIRVHGMI